MISTPSWWLPWSLIAYLSGLVNQLGQYLGEEELPANANVRKSCSASRLNGAFQGREKGPVHTARREGGTVHTAQPSSTFQRGTRPNIQGDFQRVLE
jgi:hypothetical protein